MGAAEVEEALVEEREHVVGQVSCLDGDRAKSRPPPRRPMRSGRGARLASDVAFVVGAIMGRGCGYILVKNLLRGGGLCGPPIS